MSPGRRWFFATRLSTAGLAIAFAAGAQVHWDVGAQAGATERIATGAAVARTPGPSGEIHGHVAVYPMVRVGPYAAFDLSPASGRPARQIYAGGLRVKVTPPWLTPPWRTWGFLGFGLAYAYEPSSPTSASSSTGMVEVPIGVGLGLRVRGPWELCAELGARWNLADFGGARSPPPRLITPEPPVGNDSLAVSLSVGVSLAL
jgi:hypothetical protein